MSQFCMTKATMNLHSSAIKTFTLITLGLAINFSGKQVLAQETKPTDTPAPIEQHGDVKTTTSPVQQKAQPKISPLPLTRPVEPGDRPTRTLNRFAPVPQAESTEKKTPQNHTHKVKDCSSSKTKHKKGESKKVVASKKSNRDNDCHPKNVAQ